MEIMAARVFSAKLQTVSDRNFVYITIPFSIEKVFRRTGRVPVAGTIDKLEFRSSVFPALGRLKKTGLEGKHFLVVNQAMRKALKKRPGSTVKVVIDLDTRKRPVEIPAELKRRLTREGLLKTFNPLPYTQRKEYVLWVEEAKSPEARERRLKMLLLAMSRMRARREPAARQPASTVPSRSVPLHSPEERALARLEQRKSKVATGRAAKGKKKAPSK